LVVLVESTHVIPSDEEVTGLTIMNEEIFVRRGGRRIDVYLIKTFERQRKIDMEKYLIGDYDWWQCSLTSCHTNNCLYVSDWIQGTVHKIDATDNELMRWQVDRGPLGVYVSKSCNVIVTCSTANTICEYTPSGSLVRRVSLLSSEMKFPIHTVELSSGEYAVSHWDPVHGVSVVNREGRVVFTYRNDPQSNTRLLSVPCQLVVTANDCIIVADYGNNRIISLNSTLSWSRDLSLSLDDKLRRPQCIYYDESRGRLYVGEFSGRVIIFDDISDIS